jgi:hypothetical protein
MILDHSLTHSQGPVALDWLTVAGPAAMVTLLSALIVGAQRLKKKGPQLPYTVARHQQRPSTPKSSSTRAKNTTAVSASGVDSPGSSSPPLSSNSSHPLTSSSHPLSSNSSHPLVGRSSRVHLEPIAPRKPLHIESSNL